MRDRSVGRWMSINLEARDGGGAWDLDFDGMEELLRDFFRRDLWSVVEDPPDGVEIRQSELFPDAGHSPGAGRRSERAP